MSKLRTLKEQRAFTYLQFQYSALRGCEVFYIGEQTQEIFLFKFAGD